MVRDKQKRIQQARIATTRGLVAITSIAVGILASAQMRSLPARVSNPIAPYSSLKETREALYEEQGELKKNIADLQSSIEKSGKESLQLSLTKEEIETLKHKKALAGVTKLNGQGIIITLDDSKSGMTSEDSIVHAADLRDVINLLWGSGAEAISINNQRVVINTAIDCIVNTIMVNNTRISSPFKIEAIGDQKNMYDRISNRQILSNLHQRSSAQGLIFQVQRNNDITMPVFDGSFSSKQGGA